MRDWLVVDAGLPLMERHWKSERSVTVDRCIARAAEAYEVRPARIAGKGRERQEVRARWHAARLMRDEGLSLPQIGAALNRHHTTIMHALKASQHLLTYSQPVESKAVGRNVEYVASMNHRHNLRVASIMEGSD